MPAGMWVAAVKGGGGQGSLKGISDLSQMQLKSLEKSLLSHKRLFRQSHVKLFTSRQFPPILSSIYLIQTAVF